jgi:uncharacterized protein YcbK (DUF882 family)
MTRVAVAAALVVLLCANAWADDAAPKKVAGLKAKETAAARKPPTAAEKAKRDKQLDKRIGKPPAPILNLKNGWTDETLVLDAAAGASVDQETFNRFLRCHYTNAETMMDSRLVAVLVDAAVHFNAQKIEIVSGFRAPKYNLMLRKKGHEVARNSQHSEGHAVDFRIPGVTTNDLHSFVRSLKLGGVGIYRESEFVHADTGPIRFWAGQ